MDKVDILVIGGGVIGVCTAFYLAQRGRTVTLLEKDHIGAGSSHGNAGLIVPSYAIPLAAPGVMRKSLRWLIDRGSPLYIQPRLSRELIRWLWYFRAACTESAVRRAVPALADLSAASTVLYQGLAAEANFGYVQNGGLALFATHKGLEKGLEEARLLREYGIEVEPLDNAGVRRMEPGVLPGIAGGIFYPADSHLIPDRFVQEMARRAQNLGVDVRNGMGVLGFETQDRQVSQVRTAQGTFQPECVVLAAGAWSPLVARDLGIHLPVQPAKGYSITFKRPADGPTVPLHLHDHSVVLTPMGDVLRLGGTLELAGLDLSVNQKRVSAIRRSLGDYLAGMQGLDEVAVWAGLRPLTPDTLPIVGPGRRYDNLFFATGHGMLGMSLGPVTGQVVAQLITGEPPLVDPAPLSPARFGA